MDLREKVNNDPPFPIRRQIVKALVKEVVISTENGDDDKPRAKVTARFTFFQDVTRTRCPCGFLGDPERECGCSPLQVQRYLQRLSGPMLDRIDLHIDVPRLTFKELEQSQPGESSEEIRRRVQRAREIQAERFGGAGCNAEITPTQIKKFCRLDKETTDLLRTAFDRLQLSARAHNKIIKVSRTLADLAESENIRVEHVAEAVQYRSMERKYWG